MYTITYLDRPAVQDVKMRRSEGASILYAVIPTHKTHQTQKQVHKIIHIYNHFRHKMKVQVSKTHGHSVDETKRGGSLWSVSTSAHTIGN